MLWNARHRQLDLTRTGRIMGILNVTPDSFSDGGHFIAPSDAVDRAQTMILEGADIIDIGGESTRPGADPVPEAIELARVLPVIRALRASSEAVFISIDTMKPTVAAAALDAGADIINDVSGFREPAMRTLAANSKAGCIVMHMKGEPRTMQQGPQYENVVTEVREFFTQRMRELQLAGVAPEQIVFDPGIGFGKSLAHNRELLQDLEALTVARRPLLLGVSRKSFLSTVVEDSSLSARAWPTVALTSYARTHQVRILRVHDIKPNADALRMTEAILHFSFGESSKRNLDT
jgi:dihydropteroate synthase